MKRWLKKHGRRCLVVLGIFFIATSSYGIAIADQDWKIVWYSALAVIWLAIVFVASGIFTKFFAWWDKD